jgi:predicted nucleic acid-binding Zn ribbon protein
VDAVDNSRPGPARGGAERPDPGADLRRAFGGAVHTPGTDRDAVDLPPARLGPQGHTVGRRADTEGADRDPVEPTSTGSARSAAAPADGDRDAGGPPEGGPRDAGAPRGSDIARAALEAARARHAERGGTPPRRTIRRGVPGDGTRRRRRGWSGAGADDRDPQTLGRVASRLSTQRGWAPNLAHGSVFGRWAELVGPEVAEHATPTALRDGELTVQADSTAWATQLRLLQRQLILRIASGLGNGIVTRMRIHGPSAPSWRRGPRHVRGRGPRDTYG